MYELKVTGLGSFTDLLLIIIKIAKLKMSDEHGNMGALLKFICFCQ